MSEDFKPGTRPLLRLSGLVAERAYVSREDENLALWTAVVALLMRAYLDPDPESRRETGYGDAQVVAGLRAALAENFGLEAGSHIARALVHYGCRQKPTLASLEPWENLVFEWQQRRASAPRIALMLRDAGLGALAAPALEAIDGWIANPPSVLGQGDALIVAMFGRRVVSFSLRADDAEPAHDVLFRELVASLVPPLAIGAARQFSVTDRTGTHWVVKYTYHGVERSFDAAARGTAMDIEAVIAGVDELMAQIGRTERAFRLVPGRAGTDAVAFFLLAEGTRFVELVQRLRLPLIGGPPLLEGDPRASVPGRLPTTGREGAETQASSSLLPLVDTRFATDSAFLGAPLVPLDADSSMRGLLTSLRRSFGTGRMLQAGRWVRQSHVEPPAWLLTSADPIGILYAKQELLLRKGRIGWAALVQADNALYAPGDGDLPGLLVYSNDAYFDARPAELAAIAERLVDLKSASGGASELRRFVQQIRNDSGRPLGVSLPVALSAHEVMLTSFMGVRAHLPGQVLAAEWFPVLTHPSSVIPMIVPSAFWPAALRAAWEARRLCAEPSRRLQNV